MDLHFGDKEKMGYTKTSLCQFDNKGCFGCCGRDFKAKERVIKDIKKNTDDFYNHNDMIKFRDRKEKLNLRPSGVCRNAILIDDSVLCPLHPNMNDGNDARDGHCDINYLCKTAKIFNSWNKRKQRKFLRFVKRKKMDWFDYSLNVDNGELLKEFYEELERRK